MFPRVWEARPVVKAQDCGELEASPQSLDWMGRPWNGIRVLLGEAGHQVPLSEQKSRGRTVQGSQSFVALRDGEVDGG